MSVIGSNILAGASGSAAGGALYVDDVFSTYVYEGTGSSQTITNDIDLAGEGGLVWLKNRDASSDHRLLDTERGAGKVIYSSTTAAEATETNALTSFNSNGFTIGGYLGTANFASWTFRKAPGFFDVVTYTGNGTSQNISHNLGSVPGMIWVKRTDSSVIWICYHRSEGATEYLSLNSSGAAGASSGAWNNTEPTDTVFTVGNVSGTNASGGSYVAYLFAHDDQSFGEDGDESIIKCGSYTGASSPNAVNLGFEPQFVIVKRTDSTNNWVIHDAMRGASEELFADNSNQEVTESGFTITSTGFTLTDASSQFNTNGGTYIYMAIRRPHKPPTAATEVFAPQATRGATDGTPSELAYTSNFAVDLLLEADRNGGTVICAVSDRIRGGSLYLATNTTSQEAAIDYKFDSNEGIYKSSTNSSTSQFLGLMLKRAPGFFDIVHYSGTGVARTENHGLGVTPEFYITRTRNSTRDMTCYHSALGATKAIRINRNLVPLTGTVYWNDTDPTATQFSLGTDVRTNGTYNYIAYFFASLDGISKVGSYTGTGSDINVDCGFTAGARFVLIKRTDSSGDWYVWDTARGITAGNDPYVLLNSTAAEVTSTDYIDPLNAGFTVTSTAPAGLNASGGTYIFLAIA